MERTEMSTAAGTRVHVNQIGYNTAEKKVAVINAGSISAARFEVVDAATGLAVLEGVTKGREESNPYNDRDSGDEVCLADFSALAAPGEYFVNVPGVGRSYKFTIADGVFRPVADALLKFLYYQRCGVRLDEAHAGPYAHEPCHTEPAALYEAPEVRRDMGGGWHDAGDYGRYAAPGAVSVGHLLLAYEFMPDAFHDSLGIPESGNGIPDLLDEVRFEVEFLLKCADPATGGIYHKVTTASHAKFVMPEDDTAPMIALPAAPSATGACCAAFAMCARLFAGIEDDFAARCSKAAARAWDWLTANPDAPGFKNPPDIRTGEYGDRDSGDERYWAAVEMYRLTGNRAFTPYIEKYFEANAARPAELGWSNVSGFGTVGYLLLPEELKDPALYEKIYIALYDAAGRLLYKLKTKAYPNSLDRYAWGSNGTAMNHSMLLLMAGILKHDNELIQGSRDIFDYLLGKNPLGICYVTGFGSNRVMYPHHRPSAADGVDEPVPGMVAGGPNEGKQDKDAARLIPDGTPGPKCFVDVVGSYSTNETAIYWNTPAVLPAAWFAIVDVLKR